MLFKLSNLNSNLALPWVILTQLWTTRPRSDHCQIFVTSVVHCCGLLFLLKSVQFLPLPVRLQTTTYGNRRSRAWFTRGVALQRKIRDCSQSACTSCSVRLTKSTARLIRIQNRHEQLPCTRVTKTPGQSWSHSSNGWFMHPICCICTLGHIYLNHSDQRFQWKHHCGWDFHSCGLKNLECFRYFCWVMLGENPRTAPTRWQRVWLKHYSMHYSLVIHFVRCFYPHEMWGDSCTNIPAVCSFCKMISLYSSFLQKHNLFMKNVREGLFLSVDASVFRSILPRYWIKHWWNRPCHDFRRHLDD